MTRDEAIEYARNCDFCTGCTVDMSRETEESADQKCNDCEHRQFFELAIKALSEEPRQSGEWVHFANYGYRWLLENFPEERIEERRTMRNDLTTCGFKNCSCVRSFCYSQPDRCEYKGLNEKDNLYRWHDLRKDPKDLPKEPGKYYTYTYVSLKEKAYCVLEWDGISFECGELVGDTLAWRCIEPFEG